MLEHSIIEATKAALEKTSEARFFRTERGYQGRFYYHLQQALEQVGVLGYALVEDEYVLESEYQKSKRLHGLSKRPDIVLHGPVEHHDGSRTEKNLAVFALKLRANDIDAEEDFRNLDEMLAQLKYRLGVFINIGSAHHHLNRYSGPFGAGVHAFCVDQAVKGLTITHAYFTGAELEQDTWFATSGFQRV